MTEQMLLLVNENDKFLGKYGLKSKCHKGKGLHHRAFTILIRNKKGEVLLQRRKHKIWDNFWDLTNSHPLHKENSKDETYQEAVRRCLKREWGVDFPVKKLFGFNYFAKYRNFCENEYCAFLIGEYNGKVYPNPEVIYGYRWLALDNLLKEIKIRPQEYTPWSITAIEELSARKADFNYLNRV
ncbi:isopentenyl-diphosphate delta-isomerase [Candidatus Shapirobacteria bacterium CG10_big_fil_rev_8_21_14_0_10_40_9]|uniref:isopentenyl-diphosphate Delta-isomerase n=1 Tax=Candidatus Shapirobacteria bacterium CG10_big_fil_rev_8_21_14_0_10_40_9 TaxID=1974888 RepID=A0A2M8L2T3_9BACT|nr:MAG: isopentenyl-diphosphate delta-isomerase [Candidatus Shapirobacteria bacterium CG10_big_fil_rev_8_21_14_0_10_40_9]